MENIQVREARHNDVSLWDDYIANHQEGLAYHFFAWKHAIEKSYRFECPYFLAQREGRTCGVLPTVHVHLPFTGGSLVSLPYCDVGGILADSLEIAETLFSHACRYALDHNIRRIEIRYPFHKLSPNFNKPDAAIDIPAPSGSQNPDSGKVRMMLELPGSSEALMASFKSKLRSQVNKAARDGLTSKLGGVEFLEDFYTIFAENMHDLGSPVHSRSWVRNVLTHYGPKAKCGMIFMPDNRPAAAGIILCHQNVVSIPWASSLRRFNRYNPNMLLYWSFLEFAADNGYRFFDFGRSTIGEGTYKFKAQWGAIPRPLHWEQWKIDAKRVRPASSGPISHSPGRSRMVAEQIIRKIPLPPATFFGSRLRKYISL
jgi:FemAB-related protein (PEP-CTERM system-associated)